ncbi:hypothetical protein [Aromatoleum tolulyticum]|uniref:hypothetical protein n=1 Tax=Aromatoleum tolulyticum TaxID=34027 RepID=UPI00097093DC|nr:hypothetical protein [Aromatoleum tolulyticum]
MTYSPEDAAWDEAYESMSRELYPEHKEQAIAEFTNERLRSYYLAHPEVLVPAARAFKEAKALLANGHDSAALVFAASATELFLKSSLLRPVVYGLVHNGSLAEFVVAAALSQTGFMRYEKLLAKMFLELAGVELATLRRKPEAKPLLREAADIQVLRNAVIHQGEAVTPEQAQHGIDVSTEVFNQVLAPVLRNLGLSHGNGGRLVTDDA